jgi:hypothetical protein
MTSPVPRLTPEQQGTVKRARIVADLLLSGDDRALAAHYDRSLGDGSAMYMANLYACVTGDAGYLMPALLDIITELAGESDG